MRVASLGLLAACLLLGSAGSAAPSVRAPAAKVVTRPSAASLRAASNAYAVRWYDEIHLFEAADQVADAFVQGKLPATGPAAAKLKAYATAKGDRVDAAARQELAKAVFQTGRTDLDPSSSDPSKEMEAYASLVRSVAQSLNDFTDANVSTNQERDHLADDTSKASASLALVLSRRITSSIALGVRSVATHLRDAIEILSLREVQAAHGAKTMIDLVSKLGGRTDAHAVERRAEAGARLLASLADNADLLGVPAKRIELARRVGLLGPSAKDWLAVKPPPSAASTVPLRPLCFDGRTTFVPCPVAPRTGPP